MTLLEKIENLTWWNEINKLKEILRALLTTARPYKTYAALITQTDSNNPTVKIQENTIGNIVWTRDSVGIYFGTLSNAFLENKTGSILSSIDLTGTNEIYRISDSQIKIITADNLTNVPSDDYLNNSYVEIKVYN